MPGTLTTQATSSCGGDETTVRAITIIDAVSIEIIDGAFAIRHGPHVPVASSLLRFVR